ncbi:ferredoxin [Streptomyces parvulus]
MKIVADRDRCVGAGQCARIAPELFDQGQDDGLVVVLNAEPDESMLAEADEAVDLCPAGALSADA